MCSLSAVVIKIYQKKFDGIEFLFVIDGLRCYIKQNEI